MNISSCIYSIFSVVIKECDDICYLGHNEISDFIVLEEKSGRRDNLSREHNFLLESENSAMKVFKLLSVLERLGGYI